MDIDELGTHLRQPIVLGAGGPVAHGFHAGVLLALSRAYDWDRAAPRPTRAPPGAVSSPHSRMPGMRRGVRRAARRLRKAGARVHLLEPGPRTIAAMGWNPLAPARASAVALAAHDEVSSWLRRP